MLSTTARCSSGAQAIPCPQHGSKLRQIRTGPRSRITMRSRSAIEQHILHPRYGFPLIPPDRHRCTQAMSLALGLPAKLGLLADVMEFSQQERQQRRAADAPDDQAAESRARMKIPTASIGLKMTIECNGSAITIAGR